MPMIALAPMIRAFSMSRSMATRLRWLRRDEPELAPDLGGPWGDLVVMIVHCLMVLVAVWLVDKKGRTFLLKMGTGGIALSLLASAALFHSFEAQRIDVRQTVQASITGDTLSLPIDGVFRPARPGRRRCAPRECSPGPSTGSFR